MEGRLLLDIVVREGTAALELLAGEHETLLIGRDAPSFSWVLAFGANTLTCVIDPRSPVSTVKKESTPLRDAFQTWSVMSLEFVEELGTAFPSFQHK